MAPLIRKEAYVSNFKFRSISNLCIASYKPISPKILKSSLFTLFGRFQPILSTCNITRYLYFSIIISAAFATYYNFYISQCILSFVLLLTLYLYTILTIFMQSYYLFVITNLPNSVFHLDFYWNPF